MRSLPFLLALAAAPALAQPSPLIPQVQGVVLHSKVLGEDRPVLIHTPPGYDHAAGGYPVLYITDGDVHLDHTVTTEEFLARAGRIPELIVVGLPHLDRNHDLTPTVDTSGRFRTAGGADPFLEFIAAEVIPFVEASYRTRPYRIFSGHSFGGLFAIHALLTRSELFNAVIAASPALQWGEGVELRRAEAFFKDHRDLRRTLYATLGDEPGDIRDAFLAFRDLLSRSAPRGLDWEARLLEDEDHDSGLLRTQYAGLRKAFSGWTPPRDRNTGSALGGLAELEAHYRELSKRMGFEVPIPESVMNRLGYELLEQGKVAEAIPVFARNVELHPDSPNVHDSLGEAYERAGRLDRARASYERAVKLAEEHQDPRLPDFRENLRRIRVR